MGLPLELSHCSSMVRLLHTRTLKMADDVLCVRVSPDARLLAVSLLDSTIKVGRMCVAVTIHVACVA